ncbi:MAG: prolyl oligopeptidase family serine peptidase [Kiritimatiellia bacterium]|jgi:pimeloyl-ACP methyl ester carboxylesterase|nr:prolyl oligopeptidase family serine peptidase [Kiritimatiellia bacterium]
MRVGIGFLGIALAAGGAAGAVVTNDVAFTAAFDGTEQRYVMLLPDGFDSAQTHDLLIALHGHGSDRWQFIRESRGEAHASRVAAAQNRMIFVTPDYRATTSWMGPAAEADLLQIIGDLRKRHKVGRVILSGGSMGASSALTFTALHPELIDGVVAVNGLADHVTYTNFQDAIAASFGGSKTAVPEEYRKRSAVNFPERFTMPLAVTAGGKDTSVPPESVMRLAEAARARNPFVLVDFRKDRGHATDFAATLAAYDFVIRAPRAASARASLALNGKPLVPAHATAAGVWFYAEGEGRDGSPNRPRTPRGGVPTAEGTQVLLTGHGTVPEGWRLTAVLRKGSEVRIALDPGSAVLGDLRFHAQTLQGAAPVCTAESHAIVIRADKGAGAVRLTGVTAGGKPLTLVPERRPFSREPVACSPDPLPEIAEALVEWDWRMTDGIGTPREPRSYAQACEGLFTGMAAAGLASEEREALRARRPAADAPETKWEAFWLDLHRVRRSALLANPLFARTPLLFARHAPSVMSHQLTQVYGFLSRPGGGLFVLEQPGVTMRTRDLTPASLPAGNFMTPELSFDARSLLFAYCPVTRFPSERRRGTTPDALKPHYNLYELSLVTGTVRRLTSDGVDDFFPVYLPGGDILFSSTRRGGFHRCGRGPCPVYTLSRMGPNGENPRSISFHETHEWDPCLLNDGRVIYTRWDYVDRNAVLYQQLWSARPDGGNVRIYYGNNTWNPAGVWEARAIPGSSRILATAAPHHGMSAGSVIRVDTTKGVDGREPLTRLTPDVRFPESESPLARGPNPAVPYDFDTPTTGYWSSPLKDEAREKAPTEQERRWPGHCYKSPWPFSETLFLASYSFDQLVGEAGPNLPNLFGIYLCDAHGNRELLYRDPNLSSLWARPLAPRARPPEIASAVDPGLREKGRGTFFLSNVMESWPYLPTNRPVTRLRLFQVLLKTTPDIDSPKVSAGLGALGRQVLGTVPVEPDGSAYFEAPARTPLYLQALDGQGRAVQTMRSLIYLQPGETETCIGCHEHRMKKEPPHAQALATRRPPSTITPGPEGSRPFSYPRLVQPILDRHCVSCHDGKEPKRAVLTGQPEGWATKSFNALIRHVPYSSWGAPNNNYEPLTEPLRFGALASPLAKRLESGHGKVRLSPEEWERLYTWMDANAAFYGTFDAAEQKKQLAGEVIAEPRE